MLQKNEIAKVYDTILSIPGMNEEVKVSLKIARKNLLLLNKVIERGLNGKDSDDKTVSMLDIVPKETQAELIGVGVELLQKAGLLK